MILSGAILLGLLAIWLALAAVETFRLGIGFRQAFLYLPFKFAYRIGDSQIKAAAKADPPIIYAIWHQSKLDPALMLSLLPEQTLHILRRAFGEINLARPWRELPRTITFNAQHIFVSPRLVRVLKGKGRLAVYLPDNVQPHTKAFPPVSGHPPNPHAGRRPGFGPVFLSRGEAFGPFFPKPPPKSCPTALVLKKFFG